MIKWNLPNPSHSPPLNFVRDDWFPLCFPLRPRDPSPSPAPPRPPPRDILNHWFVFCTKHVLFFTCSSPLFASFFMVCCIFASSHFSAILSSNLTSPYTAYLWISTNALRSALRRKSAHPQAPPQTPTPFLPSFPQLKGTQRKPLSFATLAITFQASTAVESEQEINKSPPRLIAILLRSAPPLPLWPIF